MLISADLYTKYKVSYRCYKHPPEASEENCNSKRVYFGFLNEQVFSCSTLIFHNYPVSLEPLGCVFGTDGEESRSKLSPQTKVLVQVELSFLYEPLTRSIPRDTAVYILYTKTPISAFTVSRRWGGEISVRASDHS